MKYFGYIEGYYGRELTHNERLDLIQRLSDNSLNSYVVASKEDPYHRLHWRLNPPRSYMNNLAELIREGKKKKVAVIPAIAPGLSYQFSSATDEERLIERLLEFIQIGAEHVALLMDDLPLDLPESIKKTGISLGEAHGLLLRKIVNVIPESKLLFCPTLYTDELLNTGGESNTYLQGLAAVMPAQVKLFWTGKNTIAESLTEESTRTITEILGDRVIFWDNLYANDYATTRLFVGPYENRDHQFIAEETSGVMINPTGMIETDKFLLDLFGEWTRTGESTIQSWKRQAQHVGVPANFQEFLPWFSSPFNYPSLDELEDSKKEPMTFFNSLLVEWQSSLKREWYPYLHRFFTELKLSGGYVGAGPWHEQRFLPYTASRLKNSNQSDTYSLL